MSIEGVINILKSPGMTSSDVVVDVRKILGEKRVGHTGTLDPAAAGVLPICIGRATRLFDYLVDKQKEYVAEICLGIETDTLDAYGTVIRREDCEITSDKLCAVLPEFLGSITQIPPIYSSLSVNGVKLYKLARKGEITEPIEERKRKVDIYSLELIEQLGKNRFLLKIRCSKGTYIRALCRDIGMKLGVPAYMPFLLRTASGAFELQDSYTITELRCSKEIEVLDDMIIPMDEAVKHIPELRLDGLSAKKRRLLMNGASIPFSEEVELDKVRRLYVDGSFIGLGVRGVEGLHVTVWLGNDDNR